MKNRFDGYRGKITVENEKNEILKPERNYGIDLLRIVSMFMVCMIHLLSGGGVLGATKLYSLNWYLAWSLYICGLCAVNCYALISGYVGVNSKYKISNIVYLWFQVVFLSIVSHIGYVIIKGGNIKSFYVDFFPIVSNTYWYFTAYFALFLFMPLLNCVLLYMPKNMLKYVIISIIGVITVLSRFNGNVFILQQGLCALWLMILYIVGGYIKKYEPFKKVKNYTIIICWILLLLLTLLTKLFLEKTFLGAKIRNTGFSGFMTYLSPTIFLVAVIMLILFSRINFHKKPLIISFFAPLTFGVYIVHTTTFAAIIYDVLDFKQYATLNSVNMVLCVLGMSMVILVTCSLIDYIRLLIFKLLRVKKNLLKLEERLKKSLIK